MRLVLLLIILVETTFIGLTLGQVTSHYDYLQSIYLGVFKACNATIARQAAVIKECGK